MQDNTERKDKECVRSQVEKYINHIIIYIGILYKAYKVFNLLMFGQELFMFILTKEELNK